MNIVATSTARIAKMPNLQQQKTVNIALLKPDVSLPIPYEVAGREGDSRPDLPESDGEVDDCVREVDWSHLAPLGTV